MLSPTASNAPARKDTHPATWNVPVVGDGLLDGVPRRSRMHPEVRGLHPRGRARGLRCVLDDVRARLSARTEWQEDGRVPPQRTPGQLSAHTECQRTGEVHPDAQDRPYIRG